MDLREWRERRLERFTLPSGLVVTLRRGVQLLDLALAGQVPTPLLSALETAGAGGEIRMEEFAQFEPAINGLVRAVMVDPPVGDEPTDEQLGIEELPATDRLAIWNWAQKAEVGKLEPFRGE